MKGLNKVTLIGHLGKDPEIRTLENGTEVASFTLATSESYRDKEGSLQTETEWHNLVAWRNLAEFAQKYLFKGSHVYAEGKLKTRSYEDKSGVKKYVTEIIVENFILLDKKVDKESIE